MRKKLSALLEVRKIIALSVIILFIILSLKNVLQTDFIQTVIVTIVSFYFAKSTALDKSNE
jgi:Na+/proline symporter